MIKRMRRVLFIATTLLSGLTSLQAGREFSGPQPANMQWFYDALKEADSLDILEGLPHQLWEQDARAVQIQKEKTQEIAGEIFYQKLLNVPAEQKKQITGKFLQQDLFVPPTIDGIRIPKPCGGFHADYALRWSKDDKVFASALVCFGCGEILLTGEKVTLMSDLTQVGKEYLSSTLKPFRQSRPLTNIQPDRNLKPEIFKPELPKKIEIQR